MRILLGLIALTGFTIAAALSLSAWTLGSKIYSGYQLLLLASPACVLVGLIALYNWSLDLTNKTTGKLKDGPRWAMFAFGVVSLYVLACFLIYYVLMKGNPTLVEDLFGKYYLQGRGHREEISAELAARIRVVRFSVATAFIALFYWLELHILLITPKFKSSLRRDASPR
jgi:hypothetical protein